MPENLEKGELVDLESGLKRVRGNKKIYGKMLQMFLNGQEYDAFEQALAQKDYEKAADVAHAIKGVTGNLGLTRLFTLSTDLMQQLRQGPPDEQTLDEYRKAVDDTRSCVENILADLQ